MKWLRLPKASLNNSENCKCPCTVHCVSFMKFLTHNGLSINNSFCVLFQVVQSLCFTLVHRNYLLLGIEFLLSHSLSIFNICELDDVTHFFFFVLHRWWWKELSSSVDRRKSETKAYLMHSFFTMYSAFIFSFLLRECYRDRVKRLGRALNVNHQWLESSSTAQGLLPTISKKGFYLLLLLPGHHAH